MRDQLEAQGFYLCEDIDDAHFILINTCAFIEAAIEESLDTILELAENPRIQSGEAKLVVIGCLPSRFGEDLTLELPEVTAFVPLSQESEIAAILKELTGGRIKCQLPIEVDTLYVPLSTPWAYVKISDGCSRHCSYCTIPSIRGPYQSYPFDEINAEVQSLVIRGACEIILIAQDTGIWSSQVPNGPENLEQLIVALAVAYPQTWFRIMYLQPEGITDELLDVMGLHTNIVRYLDIPLQHANERILASMNRKGSGKDYLKLVARIREALPGVVLRTTVMVGYPGESQEEFDELCDFIEDARFDYVGVFIYSSEEGTKAAGLPEKIDEETALSRLQYLRDRADRIGFALAQEQIGLSTEILICGQDEEGIFGRTKGQAPDVDGLTYINVGLTSQKSQDLASSSQLQPGNLVQAKIYNSVLYDLFAETIAEVY